MSTVVTLFVVHEELRQLRYREQHLRFVSATAPFKRREAALQKADGIRIAKLHLRGLAYQVWTARRAAVKSISPFTIRAWQCQHTNA